jgi:hypothetical protein
MSNDNDKTPHDEDTNKDDPRPRGRSTGVERDAGHHSQQGPSNGKSREGLVLDASALVMAQRLMVLFAGFERSHGTHGEPHQEAGNPKWIIKKTAGHVPGPATLADWRAHLMGQTPLGIVPVRADGTCVFGSLDIDDY